MADWKQTLMKFAPTVAAALGGPLAGTAVVAIGELLGITNPTEESISNVISSGKLTPEQISTLKELELKYQAEEKERGFRYEELAFKDRDSARKANVEGGTQKNLFWMSIFLLSITIGTEITILFNGYPKELSEIIVGRVLGLMDSVSLLVLSYWYGTTNGSAQKNTLLANAEPSRSK